LENDDSDYDIEEIQSPRMDVGLEMNVDFAELRIGDFVVVQFEMKKKMFTMLASSLKKTNI